MNDAKHTPGPWKIWREKRDTQTEFCICVGIEGVRLASLPDMSAIGEDEANARLIAAAPDLLAACEGLTLLIENMHDLFGSNPAGEWLQQKESYRLAKAAIRKAEGK